MTLERVRAIDTALRDEWGARVRMHESRIAGYDDERIDIERQTVAWFKVGMLLLEAPLELIGTFFPELGLFRWWWSGKENSIAFTPCRMDEAFAEAQRKDLRELLTRQQQLDGPDDGEVLCRVAACFAHASSMLTMQQGDRFAWFGVFAAQPRPPIVPDLDLPRREPYLEAARTLPPGAVAPKVSASARPEARASWPPTPERAVPAAREPGRQLLLPVAHATGALLRRMHAPVRSALLIVNVDTARDKARYFVTLVAATQDGDLASIDTTREVIDAVGQMLAEDAKSGNVRWRKLVMRLVPEGEGIAITRCEVSA